MKAPSQPVELAVGPANYAGQADAWSRAARRHLGINSWSFSRGPVRKGGFKFPSTREIPALSYYLPVAHKIRMQRFLSQATHVAFDGFQPIYSWYRRGNVVRDAQWLNSTGIHSALIAHGSEIRNPDEHMERNEFSLYHAGDPDWRQYFRELSQRNRDRALDSGLPLFVSTPDLLHELPTARWLPVCVDTEVWQSEREILTRPVPTVLHIPSRRTPPIKGTQFVDPVCQDLEARGLIRYIAPTAVPHAQMRSLVHQADIVVDQLLAASYGVAAVEAMAAGCLTIGHVGEQTRQAMQEPPPMVDVTPQSLEETLLKVIEDRAWASSLAASGPSFVTRWHDGTMSARAMEDFLGGNG